MPAPPSTSQPVLALSPSDPVGQGQDQGTRAHHLRVLTQQTPPTPAPPSLPPQGRACGGS